MFIPVSFRLLLFKKSFFKQNRRNEYTFDHMQTVHFHNNIQTACCLPSRIYAFSSSHLSLRLWTLMHNTSAVCDQVKKPFQANPSNYNRYPQPVHLAVLLLQFQLFCLQLWNPDLFTWWATCPRPAVLNSLETAGAVEILSMIGYEKPTDNYSWGADLLHLSKTTLIIIWPCWSSLTFEPLGHVLLSPPGTVRRGLATPHRLVPL